MFGPVSLGLLLYLNVELNAWARRERAAALKTSSSGPQETHAAEQPRRQPSTADKAADDEEATAVVALALKEEDESLSTRVVSTGLKGLSILFVVVAGQAPSGLVIYWLTNAVYTLGFTGFTAMQERKRIAASSTRTVSSAASATRSPTEELTGVCSHSR